MEYWQIQVDRCKACELCVAYCPKNCLSMGSTLNSRGYCPAVLSDPEACNGCALCAQVCPDVAIRVYRRAKASA